MVRVTLVLVRVRLRTELVAPKTISADSSPVAFLVLLYICCIIGKCGTVSLSLEQ